jgi:EAL domain-containing protein (putative c-di-GMP-specific phosphodiesterase class I)
MYRAKDSGRNTYRFYSEDMTATALERIVLEWQLRRALNRGELCLHYQPQLDLGRGNITGVEALVYWSHPERGLLSPSTFIPLAEESGLIIPLGNWVLRTACIQGKTWLEAGIDFGCLAVNIAEPQIRQGSLTDNLRRILSETHLPPERLELELTENLIMGQPKQIVDQLLAVRELGVKLSIDDFGTGYSSLAYLKQLPIDKLKLDQGFVRDLPDDHNDVAIAKAVIALGHSLQFKVIAEGVETEAQRRFLQAEGCDQAQGYLYSRPVPPEALASFFAGLTSNPSGGG